MKRRMEEGGELKRWRVVGGGDFSLRTLRLYESFQEAGRSGRGIIESAAAGEDGRRDSEGGRGLLRGD